MAENKWVSLGLFHPELSGVIILLIRSRGPPCRIHGTGMNLPTVSGSSEGVLNG